MLFYLLGKYLDMEFLGHMISTYLTSQKTAKLFSKVVVPLYILTSNI